MIMAYNNNTLLRVVYANANFDFLQADQVFTSPENFTTHVEETHGRGNEEEEEEEDTFFGRGCRPGGLTAWAQGRHASTRLAALSSPRGPTLSGTVSPSLLNPGGPVWTLSVKLRGLV